MADQELERYFERRFKQLEEALKKGEKKLARRLIPATIFIFFITVTIPPLIIGRAILTGEKLHGAFVGCVLTSICSAIFFFILEKLKKPEEERDDD